MARKKPARQPKEAKSNKPDFAYLGSKEESPDERTVESRRRLRDMLNAQVEEFLAKGGKIEQINPNVIADPPTRPSSSYGNRPI